MSEPMVIDEAELKASSPEDVAKMIVEASELIEQSRLSAQEIGNRGFFKRLFSNNTRDMANAMMDQNKAMSLFLKMLQTTVWINLNNTVVLGQISEELNKQEAARGAHENKYVGIAKNFIAQTYASAVAFKEQFDHLFTLSDQHSVELGSHETRLQELSDRILGYARDHEAATATLRKELTSLSGGIQEVRSITARHQEAIGALERSADELRSDTANSIEALNATTEGHAVRLANLESVATDLTSWRMAQTAGMEQLRSGIAEVEAGLKQTAAGWESGAALLDDRARRTFILAVCGLGAGLTGIFGLIYLILRN